MRPCAALTVLICILCTTQLPIGIQGVSYFGRFFGILKFLKESFFQIINEPSDEDPVTEYDFIVVGAGAAGSVVANRLTEIPDWNVLLLEAGGMEHYFMDIPLAANYLQFLSNNWSYKTKPSSNYCTGFMNQQCNWPRGKVMGGSTVLNYMIYTRGTYQDYNNWNSMGNEGWDWRNVYEYLKKIENYKIPEFDNVLYHSHNGYLNVENSPFRTSKSEAWVQGAQEFGFRYGDINGPAPASVSFLQLNEQNGVRASASRAYLHPIKERPNFHVSKHSLVTKLIFDESKTKVIGVEMEKDGVLQKIMAKKEVIISAGAINSPQLLMLSGIGPKTDLESLNIEVVRNLPVGYNLMDHVATGGLQFVVDRQNSSLFNSTFLINNWDYAFEWMNSHTGPLASPGGAEALLFMDTKNKFNPIGWPDVELLFIGGGLNSDPALSFGYNFNLTYYAETYNSLRDLDVFMVFPMLMRPKSKGRIRLISNNPKKNPEIIPNYFDHPEDLDKIIEGIKVAVNIAQQPAMQQMNTKLYDTPLRKCLKYGPFGSDEYFKCQTRTFTFTIYHQSGTCKMGPSCDHTAVVDPRLRVHGIRNLRVIDASIMPEVVSSHTCAPTYMIAEKGSDMIKEDWGRL